MKWDQVYLKYQNGTDGTLQISNSVSVTTEGHVIQSFHDTLPESFCD